MTAYRDRSEAGEYEAGAAPPAPDSTLDALSKEELLEEARRRGITPANATMSKAELREALEG